MSMISRLFGGLFVAGVCLVSDNGEIEHANSWAMKLLQCKSLTRIKGKQFTDFFLLNEESRDQFYADYKTMVFSTRPLEVKLCTGKTTTVQAYLTFCDNTGKLVGVLFNR